MSHLGGELSWCYSLSNICSNLLTSTGFDTASAIHSHHHHRFRGMKFPAMSCLWILVIRQHMEPEMNRLEQGWWNNEWFLFLLLWSCNIMQQSLLNRKKRQPVLWKGSNFLCESPINLLCWILTFQLFIECSSITKKKKNTHNNLKWLMLEYCLKASSVCAVSSRFISFWQDVAKS